MLAQGDTRLSNPYSVILINPVRHPHVNGKGGRAFIKWLTSPEGQGAINAFRLNGEQLLLRLKKLAFPRIHYSSVAALPRYSFGSRYQLSMMSLNLVLSTLPLLFFGKASMKR